MAEFQKIFYNIIFVSESSILVCKKNTLIIIVYTRGSWNRMSTTVCIHRIRLKDKIGSFLWNTFCWLYSSCTIVLNALSPLSWLNFVIFLKTMLNFHKVFHQLLCLFDFVITSSVTEPPAALRPTVDLRRSPSPNTGVNKQFNSPVGLYSGASVQKQQTLTRNVQDNSEG